MLTPFRFHHTKQTGLNDHNREGKTNDQSINSAISSINISLDESQVYRKGQQNVAMDT